MSGYMGDRLSLIEGANPVAAAFPCRRGQGFTDRFFIDLWKRDSREGGADMVHSPGETGSAANTISDPRPVAGHQTCLNAGSLRRRSRPSPFDNRGSALSYPPSCPP
jgi:hypothetical protein